ncbi:MAG TPA: hypothetical protein VGJ60_27590 [Chloroflexota bacterium]|jgi:hypothetical protein
MTIDSVGEVVRWLNEATCGSCIEWGDDGMSAQRPYALRAVDPVVDGCPVMWPWHIVGPDEPEQEAYDAPPLTLDYDLDVYEVWPAGPCVGPLAARFVARDQPLDVVSGRTLGALRGLPGAMLVLSGGWQPASISRALERWASIRATRPDLRFRWNQHQMSALKRTFEPYTRPPRSVTGWAGCEWATLDPAPELPGLAAELDPLERLEQRNARRSLRRADVRRWTRRMMVDPALRWLTPAEVRMLVDLDPAEDIFGWAKRYHIPTCSGCGLEPLLATGAVLALADS